MNSEAKPIISVVMPVLNGEKHLRKAIESILAQTYRDFEFIIINDGSTDDTEEIIKSYPDPRIVYIDNGETRGLSKSFNAGINAARGEYIARMDADDISGKNRFEKQLAFLTKHPDIGVVGSSVRLMSQAGRRGKILRRPEDNMSIKWQALFSTPLFHPTIMARAEVLRNNPYDETYANSEDYELWSRLLFSTDTKFANIHEALLLYRSSGFTNKLDPAKRIASAENTIKNIEHYTLVSHQEREMLILLRQSQKLSIPQLMIIWHLYFRAAEKFIMKENLGFPKDLRIWAKMLSLFIFLIKHKLKHF